MNYCQRYLFVFAVILFTQKYTFASERMYHRVEKTNLKNVGLESYVTISPLRLVKFFGPPNDEPWDEESLGAFYFEADTDVFVIYFRAHDFSKSSIKRMKSSFWESDSDVEFNVGARGSSGVDEFKSWVLSKVS